MNHSTAGGGGKSNISVRHYIFSGTAEQFEALIGYAQTSVLTPKKLELISIFDSVENAVFAFSTLERPEKRTMIQAQNFTGDWARFEPILTDLQALAARAGYTLLPFDSETAAPEINDNYRYWFEIHTQAKASGNVSKYLQDRDIGKSTYYNNIKRMGLVDVSGSVRQSRTKDGHRTGQTAATMKKRR